MPESGSTKYSFEAVTTALQDLAGSLQEWITTAMPYIVGVAAAFFGFYLIRVVIKLVRRASS